MGMQRAEIFNKIATSTATSGGNNLLDGRGRLCVKRLIMDSGFKGERFVAETVVVNSAKIPVTEIKTGRALDVAPNPVGSDVSIIQIFGTDNQSAFGNVKSLILSLYSMQEAEVDAKEFANFLDQITQSSQPARGMVIDYSTYRKVSQKKQVELTLPKWASVTQDANSLQAMRGWLDALAKSQESHTVATA